MGSYSISFNESALREFKTIDRHAIPRIIAAADALASDPLPPGYRKPQGKAAHDFYRIRVGQYRVICTVDPPCGRYHGVSRPG